MSLYFDTKNHIDKFACQTYKANFDIQPEGDITKIEAEVSGGFPCQSFSSMFRIK